MSKADQSLSLHLGLSQGNPTFERRRPLNCFRQEIHPSNNILSFLPHAVLVFYPTVLMTLQRAQVFYLQIPHMGPHLLQTFLCHILWIILIIRLSDINLQGRHLFLQLDLGFAKYRPFVHLILNILSLLHLYLLFLLDTTNLTGRTFPEIICMHRSHNIYFHLSSAHAPFRW